MVLEKSALRFRRLLFVRRAVGRVVFAIDRVNDGWWWCCKVFGAEAQARLAAVLNMVGGLDTVRSRKYFKDGKKKSN